MLNQQHKSSRFMNKSSKPMPRPQMHSKANSIHAHVPTIAGTDAPPKED